MINYSTTKNYFIWIGSSAWRELVALYNYPFLISRQISSLVWLSYWLKNYRKIQRLQEWKSNKSTLSLIHRVWDNLEYYLRPQRSLYHPVSLQLNLAEVLETTSLIRLLGDSVSKQSDPLVLKDYKSYIGLKSTWT